MYQGKQKSGGRVEARRDGRKGREGEGRRGEGRRVEGKDNGKQKEGEGVKDKTKEACTHTKDNLATKAMSKT